MQVTTHFSLPQHSYSLTKNGSHLPVNKAAETKNANEVNSSQINNSSTASAVSEQTNLAHKSGQPNVPQYTENSNSTSNTPVNKQTNSTGLKASEDEAQEDEQQENSNINAGEQAQYTDIELKEIEQLKSREKEVIAHEQAHAAVGGQYTGAPSYDYETGPNGVRYAVSGEVSIDTSEVPGDPQATLRKAKQIKAAALAPAEPSAQDLKVAAKADRMAANARAEILAENTGRDRSGPASLENTGRDRLSQIDNSEENHKDNKQELMNAKNVYIQNYYNSNIYQKKSTTFEVTV